MRHVLGPITVAALLMSCASAAATDDPLLAASWHLSVSTPYYGDLEGRFDARADGRHIILESRSVLAEQLGRLASSDGWFLEGTTIALRLRGNSRDTYEGRLATLQGSFRRGYQDVELTISDSALRGEIAPGGAFSGTVIARPTEDHGPLRDYAAINVRIHETLRRHVFDPTLIEDATVVETLEIQSDLAASAIDDFDLILTYAFTNRRMPFSHFGLTRPAGGVEGLMASRATRGANGEAVHLRLEGEIAILTITSFVGEEIPAQIEAAFTEIEARGARALVIDLRANGGGSLAGAVLGNHIILEQRPVGYFISNRWWQSHERAPTNADAGEAPTFQGLSLADFYDAIEANGLLRVEAVPVAQPFVGPVYLLAGQHSTSMTELLLDAIRQAGRGTIIGAETPGEMVSSRFFDVGEGFVLRAPVADYISWENGRIEGAGVTPDIAVPEGEAMDHALMLAREALAQE